MGATTSKGAQNQSSQEESKSINQIPVNNTIDNQITPDEELKLLQS